MASRPSAGDGGVAGGGSRLRPPAPAHRRDRSAAGRRRSVRHRGRGMAGPAMRRRDQQRTPLDIRPPGCSAKAGATGDEATRPGPRSRLAATSIINTPRSNRIRLRSPRTAGAGGHVAARTAPPQPAGQRDQPQPVAGRRIGGTGWVLRALRRGHRPRFPGCGRG